MLLFVDRMPLYSWLPAGAETPRQSACLPLQLDQGVAVPDVAHLPNPDVNTPLLGMRALRQAGVRIQIDFLRSTVSVWVPGAWYRQLAVTARRCLTGFRTLPPPW